jgi:signal peptidase I
MLLRWFLSASVRQAVDIRKQVRKLINAQRDILAPEAIVAMEASSAELHKCLLSGADGKALEAGMVALDKTAANWLKPYPWAAMRENIEVILVALAVALGVRTFFLQPFKIPTGSMQPTLYGITSENLRGRDDFQIPTGLKRLKEWFQGVSYVHVKAEHDGPVENLEKPTRLLLFNLRQRILIGGHWQTFWFPPDCGSTPLEGRAGLYSGQMFHKGDDVIKMRLITGDHLFVDRLSYNFRRPHRGDIVVFETQGIPQLPNDQFYIKRLIATGGERVRIDDKHHVVINGNCVDASYPGFENVYSFPPDQTPPDRSYFGHLNNDTARQYGANGLAPLFLDASSELTIRPNHYLVMGDNTLHSFDSRAWGDFPREKVIGKSCFVYWPLSSRFGWSHR